MDSINIISLQMMYLAKFLYFNFEVKCFLIADKIFYHNSMWFTKFRKMLKFYRIAPAREEAKNAIKC